MSTFAIGDIHGNLEALEDLLARLTPELQCKDTLVFLGDYIDRGPDAQGCIERIIQLRDNASFRMVTLLGNHEAWMLQTMRDHTSHSWVLGMEAFATIGSYSQDVAERIRKELETAGMRLITEEVHIAYDKFFDQLPTSHLDFLLNLELYHRTADLVFVHGGFDPTGGPVESQDQEALIWGPPGFPATYRGQDTVCYGHWGNAVIDQSGWPKPLVLDNGTVGIDTISEGVLTAVEFPSHRVIQSGRFLSTQRKQ